jgi:hypothetical protein
MKEKTRRARRAPAESAYYRFQLGFRADLDGFALSPGH